MAEKTIADRQGDVVLVHLTNLTPQDALRKYSEQPVRKPRRGRMVLAEGEVTGHAHTLEDKGVKLFAMPSKGHSLLVVSETTVQRGSLIEGKVLETMPGGTIRFQQVDGTVIRFNPKDVTVKDGVGVVVNRAYTPLTHDEHDAIPVSRGVYEVIQQQTFEAQQRTIVAD